MILFTLAFVILAVLILAFEVWMIVDAVQRQSLNQNEKLLWIIGMVLVHPIIAIAYYFMVYRKSA